MIIFSKYGHYNRRSFIEECFDKYITIINKTKLKDTLKLDALKVDCGKNNKPYFKDYPNIRFSISHSGELVVLAMSDTEVGIDIEKIKPRDYEAIVERHFTKGESKMVNSLEDFLKVWTKKEAYLKLTSEGLGGLNGCDVSKSITYENDLLMFTTLDIFEGYIGAVVSVEQPIIIQHLD